MMVLELAAPPKIADVRRALCAVTIRHEALRTVIEDQQQRALPFADPELCEVTLEDGRLREWLRAERQRPFALDRAPLWRVTLLRDGGTHLLVLTAHHLILDGSSLPIFVREFVSHYDAATADAVAPRPKQFREFCAAAAERRQAGDREERKGYWARLLGKSLPDWTPPAARRARRTFATRQAITGSCWMPRCAPRSCGVARRRARRCSRRCCADTSSCCTGCRARSGS